MLQASDGDGSERHASHALRVDGSMPTCRLMAESMHRRSGLHIALIESSTHRHRQSDHRITADLQSQSSGELVRRELSAQQLIAVQRCTGMAA